MILFRLIERVIIGLNASTHFKCEIFNVLFYAVIAMSMGRKLVRWASEDDPGVLERAFVREVFPQSTFRRQIVFAWI